MGLNPKMDSKAYSCDWVCNGNISFHYITVFKFYNISVFEIIGNEILFRMWCLNFLMHLPIIHGMFSVECCYMNSYNMVVVIKFTAYC